MSGTPREVPKGLSDSHVVRLFKCAVKDDDSLVDAIVEKLYGTMRDFDAVAFGVTSPPGSASQPVALTSPSLTRVIASNAPVRLRAGTRSASAADFFQVFQIRDVHSVGVVIPANPAPSPQPRHHCGRSPKLGQGLGFFCGRALKVVPL